LARSVAVIARLVTAIAAQFERKNAGNLFAGHGGKLTDTGKQVKSAGDFELITWFVIKQLWIHTYRETAMLATAKLFKTGHSQAVRLPKACRLPGDEVWVHKNEVTGVVTLTPKKKAAADLDELFRLIEAAVVPEEFMAERDNRAGEFREIF
jgi:virulence-associated protein VagC